MSRLDGAKVRKRRKAKGWSQARLAEEATKRRAEDGRREGEIQTSTISDIERGKTQQNQPATAKAISDALEVKIEDLQ